MRRHIAPRDWKARLSYIMQCILDIRRFTKGYDFDHFRNDKETFARIVHNLEAIGEAVPHIPSEIRVRNFEVPWTEMMAMKDIAKDKSRDAQLSLIWRIIQDKLPPLISLLNQVRLEQ